MVTPCRAIRTPTKALRCGRSAALAAAWQAFFRAFPDYRNIFHDMRVSGSQVTCRGESRCSVALLDGPALWRATIAAGLIARWEVFDDTPENRRTLGFASD